MRKDIAALLILCAGMSLAACTKAPAPEPEILTLPAPVITLERETARVSATEPPVVTPEPTPTPEPRYTEDDAVMLAKTVWGEARGCTADEQRLVVWTVLQRVDAGDWGDTIAEVITAECQFNGYDENHPVSEDIYAICEDVLTDWQNGEEPLTHDTYAPDAPYYFFDGDGKNNWFREEW